MTVTVNLVAQVVRDCSSGFRVYQLPLASSNLTEGCSCECESSCAGSAGLQLRHLSLYQPLLASAKVTKIVSVTVNLVVQAVGDCSSSSAWRLHGNAWPPTHHCSQA